MANLGKFQEVEKLVDQLSNAVYRIDRQEVPTKKIDAAKGKIMVPKELYAEMMAEIMSMPVKKRKQYRSFLKDKTGEKTKVIYEDGVLKNWSTLNHRYSEVVPDNFIPEEEKIYMTDYGKYVSIIRELNLMPEPMFMDWWIENVTHTGNHTGRVNHRQSVPTAAGQPCRA